VSPDNKVFGKEWADNLRATNVEKLRTKLSEVLGERTSFTLEIGCGHGHWLAAYAKANPHEFCLGIDLITGRIAKSLRKQELQSIKNISFLKAEATEVLDALTPVHKTEKVFILYPDPWPKRRHHKNRFLCAENLSRLAKASTADAKLYFRTDDADYYEWTVRELKTHPNWRICEENPWPFETPTFFEELTKVKRDVIAQKVS
jgi:tRNA (guanine-N7-)-methyltransferase